MSDPTEIANIAAQINACDACADINAALAPAMAAIQAKINSINDSLADLVPLLTPPTSLGGCIAWINAQINKYAGAQTGLLSDLTQTVQDIATLAAAVAHAASKIENCSVSMPTLSGLPL